MRWSDELPRSLTNALFGQLDASFPHPQPRTLMSEPTRLLIRGVSNHIIWLSTKDYGKDEMRQRLSTLLSIPANDILENVPVPVDSIFVSNQFADKSGSEELIVNQLVDSFALSDQQGKQYRFVG